jgi:hypothetical protein
MSPSKIVISGVVTGIGLLVVAVLQRVLRRLRWEGIVFA